MDHEIVAAAGAKLVDNSGRIKCDLERTRPDSLALGLALLNEGFVEKVIIRPPTYDWILRLRKSPAEGYLRLQWYAKNRLDVHIGKIELERWLAFFLKYYRDGMAEVDHSDVEGDMDGDVACDFTLKVAVASDPVSEEEARRRLGLALGQRPRGGQAMLKLYHHTADLFNKNFGR